MTASVATSIVSAEQLRVRCGGRDWTPEQTQDADRLLAEIEGELVDLLGAPISPRLVRIEQAPVLTDGVVCPRWPVHTVTSIDGATVDDEHPLDPVWLLEDGYLRHTDPDTLTAITTVTGDPSGWPVAGHAYTIGTVALGYQPGWGDVPAIRSMILRIALARFLNAHDDTMVARDLQAEAPPPMKEPAPEEIRRRLGTYRWLQVWR